VGVRRVVTGRTAGGKSVFVADEELDGATVSLMPGSAFHRIWGSDVAPTVPADGSAPDAPRFFPPADGYRFLVWSVAPAEVVNDREGIDVAAALAEIEANLPGLIDHNEPDDPGMHTTDTIDFDYVAAGEIILELDDGAEVHLRTGDCVVQNGTRHRWRNAGDQPCTIVTALVGARRVE
jgi:mannose-6-phosphate isomerase-like protein (cupin superfamily)